MKWFRKSLRTPTKENKNVPFGELPNSPVDYPSGICVVTPKGSYFLHKDGSRYRIPSDRVRDSWRFNVIVETTEAALANWPVALSKLGFRDGTLLDNIKDGKLYLVSESRLRHVTSPEALYRLGMHRGHALWVSDSDISIMKSGKEIS